MSYNQKLEEFLGIRLDDYPGSDFSPIEEFYVSYSKHPMFRSTRQLATPLCGLFDQVTVLTFPNLLNRVMTLSATDFEAADMLRLKNLLDGLVTIYGGDIKGMLWLLEEEMDDIASGK